MEILVNNLGNNMNNEVMNNGGITLSVTTDAKPIAWKGIKGCKSFPNPVTINEAVEAVGADYEVTKEHLVRVPNELIEAIKNGNPMVGLNLTKENIIDNFMATVRSDANKTLGVVGSNYGVVQNSKAFEFIDIMTSGELGGTQKPIIETAGILKDGARMYVTAKMPKMSFQDDADGIDDYILFTNTHDGSGAVMALFTPIRVICQNTLNAAIKGASNKLVFKHTSKVEERMDWTKEENMERAVAVLRMHAKFKEEFLNSLFNLKSQKIEDGDVLKFAAQIYTNAAQMKLLQQANMNLDAVEEISTRTKNQINALRESIEGGVGQNEHKGTKLWLYNGLTTYFSNEKKFKSAEDKFDSLISGDAQKKVQKGYDILAA